MDIKEAKVYAEAINNHVDTLREAGILAAVAKFQYALHDAFVARGFSSEQALELVKLQGPVDVKLMT